MNKKIAVLPGDGIGPEIIEQAVKVLKEIDFVVSKIIRENDVIYLYDNDENKYLIDNIE